jgi:hypothetical protein
MNLQNNAERHFPGSATVPVAVFGVSPDTCLLFRGAHAPPRVVFRALAGHIPFQSSRVEAFQIVFPLLHFEVEREPEKGLNYESPKTQDDP